MSRSTGVNLFFGILILGFIFYIALRVFPLFQSNARPSPLAALSASEIIGQQLINFDSKIELPEYKFYHLLIWEIKALEKRFGVNPNMAFQELRRALNLDIKSDRKILSITRTSLLQYLTMCLFTWFMLVHMSATLEFRIQTSDIMIIFCWQFIGGYLFHLLVRLITKKICAPFLPLFQMIYKVRCLVKISRPLQDIKAVMENFLNSKSLANQHKNIVIRLELYLMTIKTKGSLPKEELDCLIEEIWDSYEATLEKLEKFLLGVKLMSFLLFIIPGYFYSISLVMGQVDL